MPAASSVRAAKDLRLDGQLQRASVPGQRLPLSPDRGNLNRTDSRSSPPRSPNATSAFRANLPTQWGVAMPQGASRSCGWVAYVPDVRRRELSRRALWAVCSPLPDQRLTSSYCVDPPQWLWQDQRDATALPEGVRLGARGVWVQGHEGLQPESF